MAGERMSLCWNKFEETAAAAFRYLGASGDFSDVTLASEDGLQMNAHKMILACSSPVFQNILKANKHTHPLIYLRGIKSKDLLCILDFLYHGEANVDQENLESFVAIAEDLELKGFTGKADCKEDAQKELLEFPAAKKELHKENTRAAEAALSVGFDSRLESTPPDSQVWTLPGEHSLYMQKLDEKVNSMMAKSIEKSNPGMPVYICNACGKEGQHTQVSDHIEVEHLEGVSIPCNFCGKFFRSRHSKAVHITRGCKGPRRRF